MSVVDSLMLRCGYFLLNLGHPELFCSLSVCLFSSSMMRMCAGMYWWLHFFMFSLLNCSEFWTDLVFLCRWESLILILMYAVYILIMKWAASSKAKVLEFSSSALASSHSWLFLGLTVKCNATLTVRRRPLWIWPMGWREAQIWRTASHVMRPQSSSRKVTSKGSFFGFDPRWWARVLQLTSTISLRSWWWMSCCLRTPTSWPSQRPAWGSWSRVTSPQERASPWPLACSSMRYVHPQLYKDLQSVVRLVYFHWFISFQLSTVYF